MSKIQTYEGTIPDTLLEYDDIKYEIKYKYRNNELHLITNFYCGTENNDRITNFLNDRKLNLILTDKDGFLIEKLDPGLDNLLWSMSGKYTSQSMSFPMTLSNYKLIKKIRYGVHDK